MLKGSTPVRLSQLDVSPMVRAAQMIESSRANLAKNISNSVIEFSENQKEQKLKKERDAQIDALFPALLKNSGVDIDSSTEAYSDLLKYVKKNNPDDIMGFVKEVKDSQKTATPTLNVINSVGGGASIYEYDGSVVNPDNVFNPNVPAGQSLGFEGEYPMTYMVQYNDGGTPEDTSDDSDAYRVQASTVNETSPGLKDAVTDQTINKGDQVYRDIDGQLRKVNLRNMIPFADTSVNNYTDRMFEVRDAFNEEARKAESFMNYVDARGQMSTGGMQRFIDEMKAQYNTFVDTPLTDVQYATVKGKALFRQQLGGLRLDILGPGVLTEPDRKAIEQAIGGFGPLSNNKLAIDIVNNYLEESRTRGKSLARRYNDLYTNAPREIKAFAPQIDSSAFDPPSSDSVLLSDYFDTVDEAEEYLKTQGYKKGDIFEYNGDSYRVD